MDRNVDLGEGGHYEKELIRFVSSCNIACGGHVGSRQSVLQVMQWAQEEEVCIGAHPSYPDRENFGRHSLSMTPQELQKVLLIQLQLFQDCLDEVGADWHHIKPHGALYNDLAFDSELGTCFSAVLEAIAFKGIVFALAGSPWVNQLKKDGFRVWEEGFVDRRYTQSGTLVSRKEPAAVLTTVKAIEDQYWNLCKGRVQTAEGTYIPIKCQTVCLHSDTPNALEYAQHLSQIAANDV